MCKLYTRAFFYDQFYKKLKLIAGLVLRFAKVVRDCRPTPALGLSEGTWHRSGEVLERGVKALSVHVVLFSRNDKKCQFCFIT